MMLEVESSLLAHTVPRSRPLVKADLHRGWPSWVAGGAKFHMLLAY